MAITDPRDIPGLVAWYSAEHEAANYTDGQEMSQWTDLSGNGNHATAATNSTTPTAGVKPTWRSTGGPNGGPCVQFATAQTGSVNAATLNVGPHFTLPAAMMSGAAAGEAFTYSKSQGKSGYWDLGASTNASWHPNDTAGTIYTEFGSTQRVNAGTYPGVTAWHRWDHWSAANDMGVNVDGAAFWSTATNTVGWNTTAPLLGRSVEGAGGTQHYTLFGNMTAFVIYSRKLTTTERADLDAWLAANPSGGTAGALQPSGTLTGTAPGRAASLAATYTGPPISGSLAGTAPGRVASLAGALAPEGSLTGTAPGRSGSFAGELAGVVTGTLTGTAPARSAALSGNVAGAPSVKVGTDTSNAAYLVQVSGVGYVESNPPVTPVPSTVQRGYDKIKATAYTQPTMVDGRPTNYAPYEAEVDAHRDRIVVGGRDVTYFRGAQTPFPDFLLTEPFAYGATTLVFPQTHAAFEQKGVGALSWLAKEKRVRFQRVNTATGAVEGTDYRGVITAVKAEGRHWVAIVNGDLSGRAEQRDEQPPLFRWVRDIARHVHDGVQSMHLRVADAADIGISLAKQGGMSHLDWLRHLCAMAVKKDGTAYTLMPSTTNERVWEFRPKDTTTRHTTAYFDDANVVADLTDDIAEQPNMIWGTGTTPEGMKVKNGRYPGLKQADPAAYPFADNRTFGVGDDLSTATPGTIAAMNWRLIGAKYLDNRDDVTLYTTDTADAVEDLQEDAGLPQTGRMDPATWDALYDITVTGASLRQSTAEPMAQATYVRKWNRTGSGARASRNPGYDPTRLQVHRTIDFGSGVTKRRMIRWARRERLSLMGKNWVGTITVNTRGLVRGEHTPGAPLTAADVMPVRELRPGMNVWAPLFDGGTLFHVSGIQVQDGGRTAVLTVDTKARDMLEVWEIVARNRESRRDPARAWMNQFRKRGQIDSVITYDEVGGQVFDTITCPANQWTVFWVVGGQEGTIRKLRVQTDTPAAYALSVWGEDPGEKNLNLTIPQPMILDTDGEPVWSQNLPIFDNRILLGAWGDTEQPCGYAPGKHTNDKGNATNDPITGLFVDEGGFSYHTDVHPVLYVAIWPTTATTIKPQRIMWPQLEEGQ